MAITSITITQDNIVNGSNLVPIHSPVVFLAEVVYTGLTPPDFLYIDILDKDSNLLDTVKSFKESDQSSTISTYSFIANDFVKSVMPDFGDFDQTNDTLVYCENMTKQLYVKFYDPDTPATNDSVLIDFAHAVKQLGNYPNLEEVFYNFSNTFYAKKDSNVYSYYYNRTVGTIISVSKNSSVIVSNQTLTEIGFYRFKINADINYTIEYSDDGGEFYNYVEIIEECEGLLLKYLDNFGQYRFYPINRFYKIDEKVKQVGDVESVFTSIYDAQSTRNNIGYNSNAKIAGTQDVPSEHLAVLKFLYKSPKVYLKIGNTDLKKDWLEVICKASDNVTKRRKDNFGYIDFTIQLPEQFTIKLI